MIKKLDNPVWHSLSETHKNFSIVYIHLKFYGPDYCPFGGFENGNCGYAKGLAPLGIG